jgi:hypothetical protein
MELSIDGKSCNNQMIHKADSTDMISILCVEGNCQPIVISGDFPMPLGGGESIMVSAYTKNPDSKCYDIRPGDIYNIQGYIEYDINLGSDTIHRKAQGSIRMQADE